MDLLSAVVITVCVFIIALFGSAAALMISREIADRKLKKQNELEKEIEALKKEMEKDNYLIAQDIGHLREEYYEDNKKLNERITTISINQNILESNLEKILNK